MNLKDWVDYAALDPVEKNAYIADLHHELSRLRDKNRSHKLHINQLDAKLARYKNLYYKEVGCKYVMNAEDSGSTCGRAIPTQPAVPVVSET